MPVRADFAVLIDACVLAEASVADLYLRLSEEPRLLLPRWTDSIWNEVDRTCVEKLGWRPEIAATRRTKAYEAFEDAVITGFEHLEDRCENHPKDRHVLAAAIHGKLDTIVTTNLKHFPAAALEPWAVIAVHPGTYLITLFEHEREIVFDKLGRLARDRGKSIEETLGRLAWTVPDFASHVANALQIRVAEVAAADWRKA